MPALINTFPLAVVTGPTLLTDNFTDAELKFKHMSQTTKENNIEQIYGKVETLLADKLSEEQIIQQLT